MVSVDVKAGSDGLRIEAFWSEIARGRGYGSRALKLLCEVADQHQVLLTLIPHWLAYDLEYGGYPEEEEDRLHALNEQKLDNAQLQA